MLRTHRGFIRSIARQCHAHTIHFHGAYIGPVHGSANRAGPKRGESPMSHAACCVVIQFTVRNDAPRTAAANFFTRCSPSAAPRDRYGRCSAIVLASPAPASAIESFCDVPFVFAGPSDVLLTRSKIPAIGGYRCYRVAPLETGVATALRILEISDKASLIAAPSHRIRNHHVSFVR